MNTSGRATLAWPQEEDWEEIHRIDQKYFPWPWALAQWKELPSAHHLIFSWKDRDLHGGFALFGHLPGDKTAHLLKICFIPELRGIGLASEFWKTIVVELMIRGVSEVFLEVEESNMRARVYYQKLGFVFLRAIKGYYSDGSNGIMMSLML